MGVMEKPQKEKDEGRVKVNNKRKELVPFASLLDSATVLSHCH